MSDSQLPHPDDLTTLGDFLDDQRRKRGMTWTQMAEATGLSVSGLRKIRSNDANPSPSTLRAIEQALGLPRAYLRENLITSDGLFAPKTRGTISLDPPHGFATARAVTGVLVSIPPDFMAAMTYEDRDELEEQLATYAAFLVQQWRERH